MRINTNNSSLTTISPRIPPNDSQQKQTRAQDSYNRNASSASVIDAEFVDLSRPAKETFVRERQALDVSIATESKETSFSTKESSEQKALSAKFQIARPETPPPGTYVNIFA
jgi:hypothetical protein